MTIVWIIILLVSLGLLVKATGYFTDTSEKIGMILKMPPFVIGLLVITFGTTMPELVTSIFAVLKGETGIIASNISGTIIAHIFLGLGLAVIISKRTAKFQWDSVSNDIPFLLGSVILLILTVYDGKFSFYEAIIFLLVYVTYILYVLHVRKINPKESRQDLRQEIKSKFKRDFKRIEMEQATAKKVVKLMLIFFVSIVFIAIAAKYVIDSLIALAVLLGVGTPVLAASVVAIGSCLPEISVAISSAKKGHFDLVLGNIIGACIFDVLIIFGVIGLFSNLTIPSVVINFILPMSVAAILIQWLVTIDKRITLTEGMLMILLYITFLIKLFNIF